MALRRIVVSALRVTRGDLDLLVRRSMEALLGLGMAR